MSRIVLSLSAMMLAFPVFAQEQLPMEAPNEVQLNDLPVSQGQFQTAGAVESQPIMTSFPMAVPPTIQFGNQCPHECNPCNLNLWDNYCAEKRLWCQKCQPHCQLRCRQPCLFKGGCQPVCEPICAPLSEDLQVPCARATEGPQADTTIAKVEPEEKTASRPRPVGSPLKFWNPSDDSFSFER